MPQDILTAKHIASECGILTSDGVAIEGKDLRVMSEEEFSKIIPNLQVMARSTPSDKYDLVKRLARFFWLSGGFFYKNNEEEDF